MKKLKDWQLRKCSYHGGCDQIYKHGEEYCGKTSKQAAGCPYRHTKHRR